MSTLNVSTINVDTIQATQSVTIGSSATADALTVTSGVAGSNLVTITAAGPDSNISINLVPKGTGTVLSGGAALPGSSKLSLFYFSNRN